MDYFNIQQGHDTLHSTFVKQEMQQLSVTGFSARDNSINFETYLCCDELCLFSVKLSYVCIIVAILTQLFEQYLVKIKPSRKFGIYLACGDITYLISN